MPALIWRAQLDVDVVAPNYQEASNLVNRWLNEVSFPGMVSNRVLELFENGSYGEHIREDRGHELQPAEIDFDTVGVPPDTWEHVDGPLALGGVANPVDAGPSGISYTAEISEQVRALQDALIAIRGDIAT